MDQEEQQLIEAHAKINAVMNELLEECPPSLVAGVLQACATKIYSTILTEDEFQSLMETVSSTVSTKETLH